MFGGGYWKSGRDIETLRKEIDRLWERVKTRTVQGAWSPPIDLAETEDNLIVRAEVPGVNAEEIELTLAGQVLTIRGERRREREEHETTHFAETDFGKFIRRVELPLEVDASAVRAEYHNGMLKIVLPKTEEAKEKEVRISVGE